MSCPRSDETGWGTSRPLCQKSQVGGRLLEHLPMVRGPSPSYGFEPPVGIEPTTCRLQGGRSGHLS